MKQRKSHLPQFSLQRFQQALDLHRRGLLGQAELIYRDILKAQPNHFDSLHMLGVAALQMGNHELGFKSIKKALKINPDSDRAYNNLGKALHELKQWNEAFKAFDKAISLNPGEADYHLNRGNAYLELGHPEDALTSYEQASKINPRNAVFHNNRGIALHLLDRYDEAMKSFGKALDLIPDYADGYLNRGNLHRDMNDFERSIEDFERALAINPRLSEAHINRGHALRELEHLDEALSCYEKGLHLDPCHTHLFGSMLHIKMQLCLWSGLTSNLEQLKTDILAKRKVSVPFPALSLFDIPELHRLVAETYSETKCPKRTVLGPYARRERTEKIRIGYYSADFYNHPITYLMAELFEVHDRNRFELYGFNFSPVADDEMSRRIAAAFDQFIDVRQQSDQEVAQLSRKLGIDIAVDLKGYTNNARLSIFGEGCAPIQVSYLGYPGTLGVDYIDYIIADKLVIPVEEQANYTEKIVYMPHSYLVNDSKRHIADRTFTREELGLPETGIVFCCFNNSYKILPEVFESWLRIATAIEGSVLWLQASKPWVPDNLRKEAEARGFDSQRLVFAKFMPLVEEHLARHRAADLFLDAFPYNAHTTASDALWAGLPVLTRAGRSFASRVGASLLTAVGLPELITHTSKDYERKAIELALDPGALAALKRKLENNRLAMPLFNSKLFASHLEAAFTTMYDRHHAGSNPDVIEIATQAEHTLC